MKTVRTNYAELRAALEAGPTPGPWHRAGTTVYALNDDGFNRFSALVQDAHTNRGEIEANALLIAAANPEAIRALLAERDALREALEMMVEMIEMNGFGFHYVMDVARTALAQGKYEH